MKIRNGFVSNSSSSSFVVAWQKKPKTIEDINRFLFGTQTEYPNPYAWDGRPDGYPVNTVSTWLLSSMKWGKKEARKSLTDDFGSNFSYLLSQAAEKYRNSFTLGPDGGEISCLTLAQREIKETIDKLSNFYPRIKWKTRVDAVIAHRRKWHLVSEELDKKLRDLSKKLRNQHNCVDLPWQDATKMTEEEKATYEKARKENYEHFQEKVLKDPAYVALDEKRRKACMKGWHEPKKLAETLSLVGETLAEIFFSENPGAVFGVVEIGDDSSLGSAMEHGDLFAKLPHKKFSHH